MWVFLCDLYNFGVSYSECSNAHKGSVDTLTTPSAQYTYSDGLVENQISEAAKYVRLTEVIYPNQRPIQYGYGNAGTVDDVMSRLATISDSQGTLAAYDYLGAGTIAIEDYADIAVKLDYTGTNNSMGESSGSGVIRVRPKLSTLTLAAAGQTSSGVTTTANDSSEC